MLTDQYADSLLRRLQAFARSALRFIRAMLVVGLGLGIAGVFSPSIMNHPSRLVSAGLAIMSLIGLWNFSMLKEENNER